MNSNDFKYGYCRYSRQLGLLEGQSKIHLLILTSDEAEVNVV